MRTDTPRPIRLKDYRPPAYLIDHVDLDVALDPTATVVRSRLKVRPNPAASASGEPLVLDGEALELVEVRLDGSVLGERQLRLGAGQLVIPGVPQKPFTLRLETRINPEANKALQGLYRSRGVYCTQCEAQGFRRITYFLDRPDVLSTYTTRIEADASAAPVLLSNGNLTERGTLAGGSRHYAVWKDPFAKPCYLFALVGGDLRPVASAFRTASGRNVDLRIYVEPGKEERAHWAMDSLKRAMAWDERRFGREYDLSVFNVVAVSDFNLGAMENKGLNIFNDRLILASPETATDANFEAIEAVVAHEYFHNWTGNRITCRDWFQLCLKEGLTVYRDQEFSADERSATVQRIADVRQLRAYQFVEDQGPLAHPVRPESYIEINNFYTSTVYEKGAELVRMLETVLGRTAFRQGMDLYFDRHDGEAATVEQFIACFADVSGRDLSQFMLWYSQAGTPRLTCRLTHDPALGEVTLEIAQSQAPTPGQARKKPLHIPLRLGLIGRDGRDLPLRLASGEVVADGVLHVTHRHQRFRLTGIHERPAPSLLRQLSAPVQLDIEIGDDDLAFRMGHDSDLFNRWQAANDYATRLLVAIAGGASKGVKARIGHFAQALVRSITDDGLEPAYRAELLRLPSEADIAREIATDVDPAAIHRARRQVIRRLAILIGDDLDRLYARHATKGPFSPDAAAAGRRALRNAALGMLAARGRDEDVERLATHFRRANNMTDSAFALYQLASRPGPERSAALEQFYERWQDDHLVIDTWFAAQAAAPQASTPARVRQLASHPLFSLEAPNKVRALIGTFAQHNPVQFNRPDGAGYALVTAQVLTIDRFNPQLAARLLAAFRSWASLEPARRQAAERALKAVAATAELSRDSLEMVTRMLDGAGSKCAG
jgi:aminopeptidase N